MTDHEPEGSERRPPLGDDPSTERREPNALTDTAWGRLAGVLTSPVQTFRSIADRPTWGVALLVTSLLFVASQVVVFQKIDPDSIRQAMTQQLEEQGREMSDEQIDQMLDIQLKVGLGCNVVLWPVLLLAVSGVLLVLVNLVGGELGFQRALAVTVHGMVPLAVLFVLTMVVALGRGEIDFEEVRQGGLVASNLSFLAPEGASPFVTALLAGIDLFSLWSVALLVVGLAVVSGISYGAATAVVVPLWALLVVGLAALQLLGGIGGG